MKLKKFQNKPIYHAAFTLPSGEHRSISYLYDLNGLDHLEQEIQREYGIGLDRVTHINDTEVDQ